MRFVFISDTHGQHESLRLPKGDFLIHTGDYTERGRIPETSSFLRWFARQTHKHKIFISGNHDFLAEQKPHVFKTLMLPGIHYLEDSGIELEGLHIWGSPIQPNFYNWAFNRERGDEIQRHWDLIPANVDILLVHGPPHGVLDRLFSTGEHVGCFNLLGAITERNPKIVAFGHIHEDYGTARFGNVLYINSSLLNVRYDLRNNPIVVDWDGESGFTVVL